MNWGNMSDNRMKVNGNLHEQRDRLTEDQLTSRIHELYGATDCEPERELRDWQQRLREINLAA